MKRKLNQYGILSKLPGDKRKRLIMITTGSLAINLLYAVYNAMLGIWGQSV